MGTFEEDFQAAMAAAAKDQKVFRNCPFTSKRGFQIKPRFLMSGLSWEETTPNLRIYKTYGAALKAAHAFIRRHPDDAEVQINEAI